MTRHARNQAVITKHEMRVYGMKEHEIKNH